MAFAVLIHFMDEKPEVRVKLTQLLEDRSAGILLGRVAQGPGALNPPPH